MNKDEKKEQQQTTQGPAESNEAEMPKPTTEQDMDDLVHSETGKIKPGQLASMDPDDAVHNAAPPSPPPSSVQDVDDLLHQPDDLDEPKEQ